MNTTSKKILIGFAGVSAISASLYFLFKDTDTKLGAFIRSLKKEDFSVKSALSLNVPENTSGNSKTEQTSNVKLPVSTGKYPKCLSYKKEQFPLSKGMKGEGVRALQKALNAKYNAGLETDGCFGNLTKQALLRYKGIEKVNANTYVQMTVSAGVFKNASGDILNH